MTDRTPDPDEARLAALLAAALRPAATRSADAPTPEPEATELDPVRVARHLDGTRVGGAREGAMQDGPVDETLLDETLLEGAARDAGLAAFLADVVDARAHVASAPLGALSATVATSARAAFARAAAAGGGEGRPAARIVRGGAWGRRAAIAAAVLALATPLAVVVGRRLGSSSDARPTMDVAAVVHLHRDGRLEDAGAQRLEVGHVVAPAAGERVALSLPGGGRLIVGDDDVLAVACDGPAAGGCRRAAFALTRGEALVSVGTVGGATSGGAVLLLPGAGRLEVTAGAVHVALGVAAVAEVALRADGRVRWQAPGADVREWSGPGRLELHGPGGDWDGSIAAAASLFRDLEFFGGGPVADRPERRVSARSFTVLEADGGARASDGGAPALRFDLAAGRSARLAWTLDSVAADARSVRVLVRVRARHAGPNGAPIPDVPLPRVVFEVEGVAGATAVWEPAEEHDGRPQAARTLVLPWPADAARPRAGQPVVLRVRAERADARVWFDGAAFSFDPASAPAPERGE